MNGVHDMGGMQCYGPIEPDANEPLFHEPWERKVLALTLAMGATGQWNLDQSRFARESLPPSVYLTTGYYRIWLAALEHLMLVRGLVTTTELNEGKVRVPAKPVKRVLLAGDVKIVLAAGAPVNRDAPAKAVFSVGEAVTVVNRHNRTHTRLPGYIRHRTGLIHAVHGCHVYPDSNAQGQGEDPQWLYNVRFTATELWGQPRPQAAHVHVDCWEPYLRPAELVK